MLLTSLPKVFVLWKFFIGATHPWQNRRLLRPALISPVCGLALDLFIEYYKDLLIQFHLWDRIIDHFRGPAWVGDLEHGALGSSCKGDLFLPTLLTKPSSRGQFSLPRCLVGPFSTLGFCIQFHSCGNKEESTPVGKSPTHQRESPAIVFFSLVYLHLTLIS